MENIEEGNKIISEFMGYQILRKKYQTQYHNQLKLKNLEHPQKTMIDITKFTH